MKFRHTRKVQERSFRMLSTHNTPVSQIDCVDSENVVVLLLFAFLTALAYLFFARTRCNPSQKKPRICGKLPPYFGREIE